MPDMKVLSVIQMLGNGATNSLDSLELSIISSAAFAAGFLGIIFKFHRCNNAPFQESLFGTIESKHIRNKVKLSFLHYC